jgi:Uma2 family endonuclease
MASVIIEEQLELPLDIRSIADFRQWVVSDEFPTVGRIDYVGGNIEVDMSPEEYYSHNAAKIEIVGKLWEILKLKELGELYSDHARISSVSANLSAEPDILFLSHESLDSGRLRMIPKAGKQDLFIEVQGGPDMVAEIVSDGSVSKDTLRLPQAYYKAGVREYWLIDARKENLVFLIHKRGQVGFEPTSADADSFQASTVFGEWFRLDRQRNQRGHWKYQLISKSLA